MIINSDESKEGDGYIWVQCSYKPWLHEVCAINIILDSSEQPQHAQLATQKPHIHSKEQWYDVQMRHVHEIRFPYQRRTARCNKPDWMFLRCHGEKL